MWINWYIKKWRTKEPFHQPIVNCLYLGRFCNDPTHFPQECTLVVDMTAEFSAYQPLIKDRYYLTLPCLDAMGPRNIDDLVDLVRSMLAWDTKRGAIYVHCAAGHGRSFMVVCIYLVLTERLTNIEEAMAFVGYIRPKVYLHTYQKQAAYEVIRRLKPVSKDTLIC